MNIKQSTPPGKKQRGSVFVIVALCLFLFIGLAALAIDIGYLYTTRNELQNVADAAALAGARYLGEEYMDDDPSEMGSHVFTQDEVVEALQEVAEQNKAANVFISIDSADVRIGLWDVAVNPDDVTQSYVAPDAVRVIARRQSVASMGRSALSLPGYLISKR